MLMHIKIKFHALSMSDYFDITLPSTCLDESCIECTMYTVSQKTSKIIIVITTSNFH